MFVEWKKKYVCNRQKLNFWGYSCHLYNFFELDIHIPKKLNCFWAWEKVLIPPIPLHLACGPGCIAYICM